MKRLSDPFEWEMTPGRGPRAQVFFIEVLDLRFSLKLFFLCPVCMILIFVHHLGSLKSILVDYGWNHPSSLTNLYAFMFLEGMMLCWRSYLLMRTLFCNMLKTIYCLELLQTHVGFFVVVMLRVNRDGVLLCPNCQNELKPVASCRVMIGCS